MLPTFIFSALLLATLWQLGRIIRHPGDDYEE